MPRKVYSKKYGKESLLKRGASLFLRAIVSLFAFSLLTISLLFLYYAKDLPQPEKFTEKKLIESTKIYDRTGKILLYEMYGEEKRTAVALDQVPEYLKKAILATEDRNFYKHFGLDLAAISRSILINLRIGRPLYGGSTISQQLIRSSYLNLEKTPARKIKEVILTLQLEHKYSKDQIFEWYLNQVPFGNNAYGVEAASWTYFGKPVNELSLSEAAVLAALINKPSYLGNPANRTELLSRKDHVLERMKAEGFISNEEFERAKNAQILFRDVKTGILAPHFTLYVVDYLKNKYGEDFLRENGLKVYTSLDMELQRLAEETVRTGAERNKAFNAHNAALVAIDPKTGEVLAMVGSKNYFGESEGCTPGKGCLFDPEVNVATYFIGRQPGSAFKPFVYATAFNKGYTDQTIVVDEPTNFGIYGGKPYQPQNFDGRFRGPVTLRAALAQSLNVPSVKVLAYLAGLQDSIKLAQDMGITTLTKPPSYYGLSLVLGGGEVKLLDMVAAYSVFANKGLKNTPVLVLKIENRDGTVLEEASRNPVRVLDENIAHLITSILADNKARTPIFGPNSNLYIPGREVAAKSGTTQDFKDGWVIGYTNSLAVGVWVGNNNGEPMLQEPGTVVAGPIWKEFMEKALMQIPKPSQ